MLSSCHIHRLSPHIPLPVVGGRLTVHKPEPEAQICRIHPVTQCCGFDFSDMELLLIMHNVWMHHGCGQLEKVSHRLYGPADSWNSLRKWASVLWLGSRSPGRRSPAVY